MNTPLLRAALFGAASLLWLALAGATVGLPALQRSTLTDATGLLLTLPTPPHEIQNPHASSAPAHRRRIGAARHGPCRHPGGAGLA